MIVSQGYAQGANTARTYITTDTLATSHSMQIQPWIDWSSCPPAGLTPHLARQPSDLPGRQLCCRLPLASSANAHML